MASASVTLRSSRKRIRQSGRRSPSASVSPGSMTSAPCSVAPINSTFSSAAPRSASAASWAARIRRACTTNPMAQFGEHHAPSGPFDDRRTDDGLDAPHMLADRRLGQMQNRRGTVKSATVGHRDDAAQRGDVENLTHASQRTLISRSDQFS